MSIKVFGISRPDGQFRQRSGGWGPQETMEVYSTTSRARNKITTEISNWQSCERHRAQYPSSYSGSGQVFVNEYAGAFLAEFELTPTGISLPHVRNKGGR